MSADPSPVADSLARARAAWEHRPDPPADPPPDPSTDAHRVAAITAARWARWIDGTPERYHTATVGDFGPPDYTADVVPALTEWANHTDGRNLVILGPTGTGKTRAAFAAIRTHVLDDGDTFQFWPVGELYDALRPGGRDGLLEELTAVDVLVLDDLGSERPTDWTAERLFVLVNRRWLDCRPIVATTNLEPTDLEAAVGARAFSRLVGEGSVAVALRGHDRRRKKP